MQVAIIIKPDETIETVEYKGYDTLHDAVNGYIEHLTDSAIPGIGTVSYYCNEEYLLQDELGPVNAIGTGIYGAPVFGNVVVDILLPDGDSRGFEYITENGELQPCEAFLMLDILNRFKEKSKEELAMLHEEYDNAKPKFNMKFYPATSPDEVSVIETDVEYGDYDEDR